MGSEKDKAPAGAAGGRNGNGGAAISAPQYSREQTTCQDFGAWCVARLLAGDTVGDEVATLAAPWAGLAKAVAGADGDGRLTAFKEALTTLPDDQAQEVWRAVFRADPETPPPDLLPSGRVLTEAPAGAPALPIEAHLSDAAMDEAKQVGEWLDTYTRYAGERSPMTPRSFHEAAGLWLGSVAIARRLFCPLPHDRIYPNLYILWVADTTLFAKSTGLKIAVELARSACGHLLLPAEFTPEALVSELAGRDPPGLVDLPSDVHNLWRERRNFAAQRGLVVEEFSGLLASARRDYNAGLTEMLLQLHDCPSAWERRTQSYGLTMVRDAYLSLLAATTPAALGPYLTRAAWLSGFWPRFALLSPDVARPPFRRAERPPERPNWLGEHLSRLACKALPGATYPAPPDSGPVALSDAAHEAWGRYDKALRYQLLTDQLDHALWGFYGRLPTQAIKVGTILAALDWDGGKQPTIMLGHWARAQQIVETWRAGVHRLLVPARVQEEQRREERVLGVVHQAGEDGVTARDIYRALAMTRPEIEAVIRNLIADGILAEVRVGTTKRGGRPTVRYTTT